MNSIYEKIDNSIETFLNTLKRFPLASFSAFLLTMILLILMEDHQYDSPSIIIASKVAFITTLGIFLFPALQLLGHFIILPLFGLIAILFYYYVLPHNINDANHIIIMRHILLILALFFMIIWAPFIGRKSDNDNFWQYAQSIIFGFIIAIFFSTIIYGGLATALYAIERLFNFDLPSLRYGQLALIIFGIFGINFFLSQIPKHPLFMQVRPYSKTKRIFSKNILAPIAIMYFVILFAYTAKILINMTWPTSTLSWIIIIFSLVAIVSFLFLSPYLKKSNLTRRFIWFAIFLQTIMLGMALWIRIEEYGITYNRYLLGMFGLWLALMSFYFILFKKAQQKWLFFFASVFILFSQFGSYSAKNVTQKSQTVRLVKLIETAYSRSEELNMKRKYEISDGIKYINDNYDINTFEKVIPHILKKYKLQQHKKNISIKTNHFYNFPQFATKELGFKFVNKRQWLNYKRNNGKKQKEDYYFYSNNQQSSVNIKGYSYLIKYYNRQNINRNPNFSDKFNTYTDLNLSISLANNQLKLKKDNNSSSIFNLNDYVSKLIESKSLNKESNLDDNSQELPNYENHQNNIKIKILFQELTITHDGNITDINSQILLNF